VSVTITVLTNDGDGLKVTATLSGAPTGALTWYQAEKPEDLNGTPGSTATAITGGDVVSLGGNQYRLTLQTATHPIPRLTYIRVQDTDGVASMTPAWRETAVSAHVAVWLSVDPNALMPDLAIMDYLVSLLNWNRPGINKALQAAGYTSSEVKAIQIGPVDTLQASPFLEVAPASWTLTDQFTDRYELNDVSYQIRGYCTRPLSRADTRLCAALAGATHWIVSRHAYHYKTLASTLVLNDGRSEGYRLMEYDDTANGLSVARFDLTWKSLTGGFSHY